MADHLVICGDGSTARFSTPERAAEFASARRASARINAALLTLAYGAIVLAILLMVMEFGHE